MGLNLNSDLELFVKGKKSYRVYQDKSILMLGKQTVNFTIGQLYKVLKRAGFEYHTGIIDISDKDTWLDTIDSYDLFRLLGFSQVHALDINDYEGADIIMDLASNEIPEEYSQKFDYILDGGTFEHVFDITNAFINTSKMLKIGGVIVHVVPADGWCNHGFYQFSPTSMIDFYEANGFFVEECFLFGYKYPDTDFPVILSPDCRFIDTDLWIRDNRRDFRLNMVFSAEKICEMDDFDLHFTQNEWKNMFDSIEEDKTRYDYNIRFEQFVKEINKGKRAAIYGKGETARHLLYKLDDMGLQEQVVCIYIEDREFGSITFDGDITKKIMSINTFKNDGVDMVFIASVNPEVIDIIRNRLFIYKRDGLILI